MYKCLLRNRGQVNSSTSSQKDAEQNQTRGKIVGDLNKLKHPHLTHRWLNLTLSNHLTQSLSVIRKFCDRLAVVPRLPGPVINGECKMVSSYRARHRGTKGLDGFHCCSRRGMLEDYAKPREVSMEFP